MKLSHLCFCNIIISICFCFLLLHVDRLICGMRLDRHRCVNNSAIAWTGFLVYQELRMPPNMTAAFFLPSSRLSFQLQLTHLFAIYEANATNMKPNMHACIHVCVYVYVLRPGDIRASFRL